MNKVIIDILEKLIYEPMSNELHDDGSYTNYVIGVIKELREEEMVVDEINDTILAGTEDDND